MEDNLIYNIKKGECLVRHILIMNKKILIGLLALATVLSTGCSVSIGNDSKKDDTSSVVEDVVNDRGFDSSEDVIKAYWEAYKTVKYKDFENVFPECESGKIDMPELVQKQYDNAKNSEATITITGVEVTDTKIYDLNDFDFDADILNISKAESNAVVVSMDQIVDGKTCKVEENYEFITVKVDGKWFCLNITSNGANIVDESDAKPETTESETQPTTESTTESIDESSILDTTSSSSDTSITDSSNSSSITNSLLSNDIASKLKSLQTDVNKVTWGVQYAPIEDMPGVVFSITPTADQYGNYVMLIAITNLYDTPVSISAEGTAKDTNGGDTANIYIFADTIGSGNTVINKVNCKDMPNGEVHWDKIEAKDTYRKYIPWEGDWSVGSENNAYFFKYNIYGNETFTPGDIWGLALDKDGFVVYVFNDYQIDKTKEVTNKLTAYTDLSKLGVKDFALFANPTKYE